MPSSGLQRAAERVATFTAIGRAAIVADKLQRLPSARGGTARLVASKITAPLLGEAVDAGLEAVLALFQQDNEPAPAELPAEIVQLGPADTFPTLASARRVFEIGYLTQALERCGGNVSKTARKVGMHRAALHRKLVGLRVIG